MDTRITQGPVAELKDEGFILPCTEGMALEGFAAELDGALGGVLTALMGTDDFKGKAGQVLVMPTPLAPVKRVALVGLGKAEELTPEKLRQAAGRGASALREAGARQVAILAAPVAGPLPAAEASQALAEGAALALYQLLQYKTKDREEIKHVDRLHLHVGPGGDLGAVTEGWRVAGALVRACTWTRDLVAHPSNHITAAKLAEEATAMAKEVGLEVEVWDKAQLQAKGFGGVLGVNAGSTHPPRFIILRHRGAEEAPIALVGKGITFDTGGISIKPGEGMDKMKYDMAGGAATLGAMRAIAELKIPRHVVCLVPATDNMPSGDAIKPGDVLTSYAGLTVEVLNTDAEGRLILMDAIAYARKDLEAQAIVDVATLTGACIIALGHEAVAVLGNHEGLVAQTLACGEATGDRGWELPLWKEYADLLKSDIADMKNIGGREAGTITAACFLHKFAQDTPWVHLDIAGTAWSEKDKAYRGKGPTAVPLRLMVDLIRHWQGVEGKGKPAA